MWHFTFNELLVMTSRNSWCVTFSEFNLGLDLCKKSPLELRLLDISPHLDIQWQLWKAGEVWQHPQGSATLMESIQGGVSHAFGAIAGCCSHSRRIMSWVEFHRVDTSCIRLCCGSSSKACLAASSSLSIRDLLKCPTIWRHHASTVDSWLTFSAAWTESQHMVCRAYQDLLQLTLQYYFHYQLWKHIPDAASQFPIL